MAVEPELFRGLGAASVVVEDWVESVLPVLPVVPVGSGTLLVVAVALGLVDLGVHTPAWQVLPVAHLTPQAPQLLGSVAVLTQAAPQRVREAAGRRKKTKGIKWSM